MAKTTIIDESQNGRISMTGEFTPSDGSPKITFTIHDHHVYFKNTSPAALGEEDRLALMNAILGKYRSLSSKDCGMFSSALGITDEGNIYIAYNSNETDQTSKNCAEANLSNTMSLLTKGRGKFTTVYMMAGMHGKDGEQVIPPEQLENLILPCGRCCDILRDHTMPDAMLYALPANNGKSPITLTDSAEGLEEVEKGQAWKLSVQKVLLRDSEKALDEEAAEAQRTGWAELVGKREERKPAQDEREAYQPTNIMQLLHKVWSNKQWISEEEGQLYNLIMAAAMNAATGRESVAAIDANPTPEGINHFMAHQITQAHDHRERNTPERRIRCAVLRFADGTFSSATEIRGEQENSMPSAEFTALAMHRITKQPITDLWVMEANEQDINAGRITTSDKQALERLYKQRPKEGNVKDFSGHDTTGIIHPHYIPFNDGTLKGEEVEKITFSPDIKQIYAGLFAGSQQLRATNNGCCHSH